MSGMARPSRIDSIAVKRARAAVARAQSLEELRCAQAILLPAVGGATLEQTAALLGVGRASVSRLQARFRRRFAVGPSVPRNWGGRRRALLSAEKESAFLEPWVQQAKRGGLLVVSPMRAALAQQLGRPVAATVLYRMLERHGWRKVAPDTRHPNADPQAQADWKKNSRMCWRICSPPNPGGLAGCG
jgi:transposase